MSKKTKLRLGQIIDQKSEMIFSLTVAAISSAGLLKLLINL